MYDIMALFNEFFSKNMKRSNLLVTAKGIIYNKYVLYAVFLGALFDLLYSVVKEDYLYCVIFVLVGFLIAFFNKNMTVILTLTMALSTIIRNIIRGSGLNVEGMKESKTMFIDDEDDEDTEDEYAGNSKNQDDKGKLMDSLKENALDLQEAQQNIINGFEKIEPYMNQAEDLIGEIEKTAKQIQGMRNIQTA